MGKGKRYEIVRTRNFLDHRHGQVTQIDTEVTIRCGDKAIDNIVLHSMDFLPGLRVVDSSGEECPLLSNEDVRKILHLEGGSDRLGSGLGGILDGINKRQIRLLWIKIPPHKRLQANEVRIIHLKYDHSKGRGGLLSAARSWQRGSILIEVPSHLPFPAFWILRKPEHYDIVRRRYSRIEGDIQKPWARGRTTATPYFATIRKQACSSTSIAGKAAPSCPMHFAQNGPSLPCRWRRSSCSRRCP